MILSSGTKPTPKLGDVMRRQTDEASAVVGDLSPGRACQAHDRAHGRGLAGAVAAEQAHYVPFRHFQADAEQDVARPVMRVHVLELEMDHIWCSPR